MTTRILFSSDPFLKKFEHRYVFHDVIRTGGKPQDQAVAQLLGEGDGVERGFALNHLDGVVGMQFLNEFSKAQASR